MARLPVDQPYTMTTRFGDKDPNALYGLHSGNDYAVDVGTPVHAVTSGTIVSTINHWSRGNMATLFDGQVYHRFMHNTKFNVNPGQNVVEGDVIAFSGGAVGAPGAGLSTGPHVHWDINRVGVDTNSFADFIRPEDWLADNQGGSMSKEAITKEEYTELHVAYTGDQPPEFSNVGKPLDDVIQILKNAAGSIEHARRASAFDFLQDEIAKRDQGIEKLRAAIADLQKTGATKDEVFKYLQEHLN